MGNESNNKMTGIAQTNYGRHYWIVILYPSCDDCPDFAKKKNNNNNLGEHQENFAMNVALTSL